ncbi:MAG: hypothetical protein PHC33_00700 [Candidatus Omnitrophica bacterium]|nr:hypothetical protein [Candidatus Omnitrophota bacterium]
MDNKPSGLTGLRLDALKETTSICAGNTAAALSMKGDRRKKVLVFSYHSDIPVV